ncbi:dihydropteroate synthase, partial [Acinetobacter baumannii]
MVTVFGILNLTEDSFFDESRRLDPAGAVTAAIEMLGTVAKLAMRQP